MARRMLRHEVPIDNQPHEFDLGGNPLHVGARRIGVNGPWAVEFWAEGYLDTETLAVGATFRRRFQVYGTGHALPEDARWRGSAERTPDGLVFHLYELGPVE